MCDIIVLTGADFQYHSIASPAGFIILFGLLFTAVAFDDATFTKKAVVELSQPFVDGVSIKE